MTDREPKMTDREVKISELVGYKEGWRRVFLICNVSHYALGALMVVLSSLVAAKPQYLGLRPPIYDLFAWIVAASTAVLTVLKLSDMATRYHNAWVILNTAIALYRADHSQNLMTVVEAWRRGEEIIYSHHTERAGKSHSKVGQ